MVLFFWVDVYRVLRYHMTTVYNKIDTQKGQLDYPKFLFFFFFWAIHLVDNETFIYLKNIRIMYIKKYFGRLIIKSRILSQNSC